MYARLITLALATVLLGTGCATSRGLEGDGDPVTDATRAYHQGDETLAAMSSVNITIPGFGQDQTALDNIQRKYGVHYLNGTSTKSADYAVIYNKTIFALKGCNWAAPMDRCER